MLNAMSVQLSPKKVLYLGDGSAEGAAAYLLAIGHWAGHQMQHLPSAQPLPSELWAQDWDLVILSDYPACGLTPAQVESLAQRVREGMGLWMIGGWSSFRGQQGHWQKTGLHELLPVQIQDEDDRINCDTPAVARVEMPHSITQGLPFAARPPSVGGYNAVRVRPLALQLLSVQPLGVRQGTQEEWVLEPAPRDPLLAVMSVGAGRSVAWMTDVAPHWVGGWVDWGERRLNIAHPESREVEIGADYAKFVARIMDWCAGGRAQEAD